MEYIIYNDDTIMPFGRYKGISFGEVLKKDEQYAIWFVKEIDNVIIEDCQFEELKLIMAERRKNKLRIARKSLVDSFIDNMDDVIPDIPGLEPLDDLDDFP